MPENTIPSVTPYIAYQDPNKAIEWLIETFGFSKIGVYTTEDGDVNHADLKAFDGTLMISPAGGLGLKSPSTAKGTTVGLFVRVPDRAGIDEHYARSVAAGVELVVDLEDKPHGSYEYTCRDLEGHLWTFGTYNPYA